MSPNRLRLSRGGALALLACCCLVACQKRNAEARYQTSRIQKGDITQVVTASGTLGALVSVDVGSQISGRIQSLAADFNTEVKKGELVAQIDPAIYQAALDEARGNLESAQAALQLAILTAQRKRELVERKAGTQADADKADADLAQARATLTIRRAQLERAEADLSYCRIVAPVDGIVISRKVDVGQTVAAAMTTPVLYTIAQDITRMHIVASVSEADIGQVAVGQKVDFAVDAFPDETFHGTVSQVRKAPSTTNNVVTYDTVIDVENPERKLFPGMTAEVSIYVAARQGILTVPNAALRFSPPDDALYEAVPGPPAKSAPGKRLAYRLRDGGKLLATPVRTGISDGIATEVIDGLSEGESVVTATSPRSGPMGGPPPPPGNK